MKQNNIPSLPRLKDESFENIFNVYEDEETSLYYYNLLQTINFPQNLPDGYFTPYTITYGDSWPFISYKVYDNPNVWWLLMLANNIQNPVAPLEPGTTIKIPKIEVLKTVIAQIKTAILDNKQNSTQTRPTERPRPSFTFRSANNSMLQVRIT